MSAGSLNGAFLNLQGLTIKGVPLSASGVNTITGDSGSAVSGAVSLIGSGGITVAGSGGDTLTISGGAGAGVASIQKDTVVNGAITFAGAGVAQSGTTFTFSGAGAGVSSVAGGATPATGAITLQGAGGITIGGAGGSGGTITITQGAGGSGNVVATTSTSSATALEWVAGVYNPGAIVYDTTSTPAGEVYVCSATTTGTDTAPHLNAPAQWNLLSSPGAGGGSGNVIATTSTTSATALEWVAGIYNPGAIVYDTTSTPAGEVYVCSATTTATDGAPHTASPAQWNLLSSPGAGGGGVGVCSGYVVGGAPYYTGTGTFPAWAGSTAPFSLTLSHADLEGSLVSGTLPAQSAFTAKTVWVSSWQLEGTTTSPQVLTSPKNGSVAPSTYIWNANGVAVPTCGFSWILLAP